MSCRFIAGLALAVVAISSVATAADMQLSADKDGVRVRAAGFEAQATRSSFDEATRILVLEGTDESPVKFSGDKEMAATCLRLTFHQAKGTLMLEGGRDTPATLVRGKTKPELQVQAKQIRYDLTTGTMEIEEARVISVDRPKTP